MIQDKTLADLPQFRGIDRDGACGTSDVQEQYLKERNAIDSPEALTAHIEAWHNLWVLAGPGEMGEDVRPEVEWMLTGLYDPKKVLDYIDKMILKDDSITGELLDSDPDCQIAAHIMLPASLMQAFFLSNACGVGHDLGLVRLFLDPHDRERKLYP